MGLIPVFLISLERTPERLATMRRSSMQCACHSHGLKQSWPTAEEQKLRRIMPRPNSLLLRFPLTAGQIASTQAIASNRTCMD